MENINKTDPCRNIPGHRTQNCIQSGVKTTSDATKVLIIGLGQLGLPVAKYVSERGYDTYGYDINTKAMERAEETAGIKRLNNYNNNNNFGYEHFDVFIISVSTHKPDDMFTPQIDGLLSIIDRISREAKNGALVSIESTIPRGTSKRIFDILGHRLHVVHAPHRWYALEEKEHGVNQVRVIGGVCDCCLKAGMQFYNTGKDQTHSSSLTISNSYSGLGIPMHSVSNIEIAEITKLAENAHRYLQIAFAEELYLYCQANNINFPELRDALNTKWNVEVLEPREGIGGHCLPKDTTMFLESSKYHKSKILTEAVEVDKEYRRYIGRRVQIEYVV